jgi:energy-coupling factor transport system ATP-binding protein
MRSAVSERIAGGDVVAVAGPSGCGKTTLCRTLAGFVPTMIPARVSGDVFVGGERALGASPESLATRIGLVQQDPDAQICTLRVWQEVAFGPENLSLPALEVRARVERSLDAVGIAALRDRTTTTLSGGESSVWPLRRSWRWSLDEPTANLDPRGVRSLFELLL